MMLHLIRISIFSAVAILLAGCGSSPLTHYYTLGIPVPAMEEGGGNSESYRIVVGPIGIPEVVDRPQIVLQTAPNRVAILEQHRWSEPLKSEISHVITASLTQQMKGAWVTDSRNGTRQGLDYQISVDLRRFESLLGEAVTIEALWVVRRTKDGEQRMSKSLIREPTKGDGCDALAAAHGRALISMSRDIAAAIRAF